MTAEELTAFEKKYGYKPAHFRVAADALAIYVNKDNPVLCLTLQQLDQIFSATRQGSGSRSIDTWGGVGMTGEWATKPIAIYGRNSLSGTYEFFRSTVLYNGEYKESVKQQPGSAEVVRNVADDKYAIGYSGLGYKTEGVRTVPLAAFYGAQCYATTAEATYSRKYPVARYLYIYLNKAPDEPLDPLRAEFIKYILSKDGQTQTEEGGYFPITNELRERVARREIPTDNRRVAVDESSFEDVQCDLLIVVHCPTPDGAHRGERPNHAEREDRGQRIKECRTSLGASRER